MKLVTVVGARPQFIKAAVVSRAIREHNQTLQAPSRRLTEIIVHTGQHYDDNMSGVFFDDLDIPRPDYDLGIGSLSHGAMTGRMTEEIEKVLMEEKPDWVLVYGDTNSTLAGALAAVKLHIPVAHVEAGLRSFNRRMPEEINRILTDHVATLLFCPTEQSVVNLQREGVTRVVDLHPLTAARETAAIPGDPSLSLKSATDSDPIVCKVGDVMYDAALFYAPRAEERSRILEDLELTPGHYVLATVHRAENTDAPLRLAAIFQGLALAAEKLPVVLPLHPRTRQALSRDGIDCGPGTGLRLIDPVGYLDMVRLENNARVIVTDSGGVQKEAYFYGVPCLTLRAETEWVELVEAGWNRLVASADPGVIGRAIMAAVEQGPGTGSRPPLYGDGLAGQRMVNFLQAMISG